MNYTKIGLFSGSLILRWLLSKLMNTITHELIDLLQLGFIAK